MIEIDPLFDYSKEQRKAIAFIDMKSFYASVECVELGLNPLTTSLCVMSDVVNSAGLILASSPTFKKVFGKSNVGRSRDLPFNIHNRKFNYSNYYRTAPRDWLNKVAPPSISDVAFIESWAKRTKIVPPRMSKYIEKNIEIQHVIQNFASPEDIFWYSIDEGFVDLTSSLNYFYERSLDLSQVFRQIFVESVFLFSKMIFQTHLGFGNQLSYECDFDCTNLQCI